MKYLELPFPIQREILREVEITNLFILSQCSKRLQNNIKFVRKPTLENLKSVTYRCRNGNHCEIATTDRKAVLVIRPSSNTDETLHLEKKRLFGMDVFCLPPSYPVPWTIICDDVDLDPILQKIHAYIADFFGASMIYELEIMESKFIPKLGIFSNSIHMPDGYVVYNPPKDADYPRKLEEYLDNSPIQNYLYYKCIAWNFRKDSRIYDTDELELNECLNCNEILQNFNGTKLYLIRVQTFQSNKNVIKFLKKWMKKEGPPNLNYLNYARKQSETSLRFDKDWILQRLDANTFDSPRKYHFWKRSFNLISYSKPTEISFESYIVRPSDGNVASILIKPNELHFVDWRMPLDQLLNYESLPVGTQCIRH